MMCRISLHARCSAKINRRYTAYKPPQSGSLLLHLILCAEIPSVEVFVDPYVMYADLV